MKNLLLPLLLAITYSVSAQGLQIGTAAPDQNSDKPALSDRLYVGGSFGGGISSYYTYVDASPLIGYMLTDQWSAGVGFTYQYFNNKLLYYKTNIVGPRVFTRYQLFDFLFVHGEYEHLFLKYKDELSTDDPIKVQAPGLLVGGGFSSGHGRTMFYIMLLYNILENQYTPYSNPVLRVGFNFGL